MMSLKTGKMVRAFSLPDSALSGSSFKQGREAGVRSEVWPLRLFPLASALRGPAPGGAPREFLVWEPSHTLVDF